MVVLGLLLLLSAAGLTVDLVVANTASIGVTAAGQTLTLTSGWLFAAGAAAGAAGLLGVVMLVGGTARVRRRRAALAESRDSLRGVQAERDRLAAQLERVRSERIPATGVRDADGETAPDEEAVVLDDHEPAVIDVDRDARVAPARNNGPFADSPSRDAAEERREPVGSRPGLFHRRP